jgi:hypothetical protein
MPVEKHRNEREEKTEHELWITTKMRPFFYDPSGVKAACRESLQKLGLSYVDLYLVHWPFTLKKPDDLAVHVPKEPDRRLAIRPNSHAATYRASRPGSHPPPERREPDDFGAGEIAIRARHPGAAVHEPGRDAALHAERGTRDAT